MSFGFDIVASFNRESSSLFGLSFKAPDGITPQSEQASKYFAGEKFYDIKELEVFQLV